MDQPKNSTEPNKESKSTENIIKDHHSKRNELKADALSLQNESNAVVQLITSEDLEFEFEANLKESLHRLNRITALSKSMIRKISSEKEDEESRDLIISINDSQAQSFSEYNENNIKALQLQPELNLLEKNSINQPSTLQKSNNEGLSIHNREASLWTEGIFRFISSIEGILKGEGMASQKVDFPPKNETLTTQMAVLENRDRILGDLDVVLQSVKEGMKKKEKVIRRLEEELSQRAQNRFQAQTNKIQEKIRKGLDKYRIDLNLAKQDLDGLCEAQGEGVLPDLLQIQPEELFQEKVSKLIESQNPDPNRKLFAAFKSNSSFILGSSRNGIEVYDGHKKVYFGDVHEDSSLLQSLSYIPKHDCYCIIASNQIYKKTIDEKEAAIWVKDLNLSNSFEVLNPIYSQRNDILFVQSKNSRVSAIELGKARRGSEWRLDCQSGSQGAIVGFGLIDFDLEGADHEDLITVTKNGWIFINHVSAVNDEDKARFKLLLKALIPLATKQQASEKSCRPRTRTGQGKLKRREKPDKSVFSLRNRVCEIEEVVNICLQTTPEQRKNYLCVEIGAKSEDRLSKRIIVLRVHRTEEKGSAKWSLIPQCVFNTSALGLRSTGGRSLQCSGFLPGYLVFHRLHLKPQPEDDSGSKPWSTSTFSYCLKSRKFMEIENLRCEVGDAREAFVSQDGSILLIGETLRGMRLKVQFSQNE